MVRRKHKGASFIAREPTLGFGAAKDILAGANWLKTWREARTLTVLKVARRSGLSQARIRDIESGEDFETPQELEALARVLETTPGHITASRSGKRYRYTTPTKQGEWHFERRDALEAAARADEGHRDERGRIYLSPLTKIETDEFSLLAPTHGAKER